MSSRSIRLRTKQASGRCGRTDTPRRGRFGSFSDRVEDMGKTTTVVKIEPGRIKVIRQGGIRSEQRFVELEETRVTISCREDG